MALGSYWLRFLPVWFAVILDGAVLRWSDYPWPDPFLCRINALMGSGVAGACVNPADQRWGFWPLLPLGFQLLEQV
ncbi:hypothetical protein [Synechococcus sp. ROS8604]|uniref:hypothetical protein n=1 Tax=Synechococcus sp. ROS8604 TaxID=1442557 RepID=UPI001647CAB9|nr:hypothetical protein [Synechococcus sp. ROS8604]QNI88672.1 hypothetical protein SynROS8604_02041 [Synechococcus sp. ROS8604]